MDDILTTLPNFATIYMSMRKYFLITTFVVFTPITFLLGLILLLNIYSKNNDSAVLGQAVVAYAALPSEQNIISGEIGENNGAKAEKIRQFLARYGSPLEP